MMPFWACCTAWQTGQPRARSAASSPGRRTIWVIGRVRRPVIRSAATGRRFRIFGCARMERPAGAPSFLAAFELISFDLPIQRRAFDFEDRRCLAFVPVGVLERLEDVLAFDVVERLGLEDRRRRGG